MDSLCLVAAAGCEQGRLSDPGESSTFGSNMAWITYAARRNPVGLFCAIYVKIIIIPDYAYGLLDLKRRFGDVYWLHFSGLISIMTVIKTKTTSEEVVLKHTCAAGRTGDFEKSLFELVV